MFLLFILCNLRLPERRLAFFRAQYGFYLSVSSHFLPATITLPGA